LREPKSHQTIGSIDNPASYFFTGAGAAGVAGALIGAAFPPTTDEDPPRCHMIPSPIEPIMNSTAATVVMRVRSVAPARAPNAVWLPLPPNALAMSPPRPCWSRIAISNTRQITTYTNVIKY
jgi:hypothetical protein